MWSRQKLSEIIAMQVFTRQWVDRQLGIQTAWGLVYFYNVL